MPTPLAPAKHCVVQSELHGWGDSNLYMRRRGARLTLSTEHRAAPSQDHIPIQLTQAGSALALSVAADDSSIPRCPKMRSFERQLGGDPSTSRYLSVSGA